MKFFNLTRNQCFNFVCLISFFCLTLLHATQAIAADGDLDLPFNVSVQGGTGEGSVNTIVVGADGKIYIAGDFNNIAGTMLRNGIARFNADGTIDTTFVSANDSNSSAIGLALQADGKVITNTTVGGSGKIARFNADGSLDSTFPPIALTGFASSIILQADGKILVAGTVSNVGGTARVGLFRLNSNGSLDTTFNPTFANTNGGISGAAIAVQTDGKIIVGGLFTQVNGTNHRNIARLNADGTTDASFGTGIGIGQDTTNTNADVRDLALRSDGKIYIGGNFASYDGAARNRLARLNADGSVDATFAPNIAALGSRSVATVAAQPDNKLLVGGFFTIAVGGTNRLSIFRLNADGSLDTTFAAIGTNSGGSISDITLQTDGKILVGGVYNTFNGVARKSLVRLQNAGNAITPTTPRIKNADFDNDGKADPSVVRVVNGAYQWFVQPSSGATAFGVQFGSSTDKLAPADYDGDGKTDIAVWREAAFAYFYILQSSTNTVRAEQFGQTGDVLTVGDWDGDGKADPSVYRDSAQGAQSYFYYRGSLGNPNNSITFQPFGTTSDKPMRGDFDGDGKFDLAVFRPSSNLWIIRQSSNAQVRFENWGVSTDKFVPADYDGDGKFDLAVFRNGGWYIKQSSDSQAIYRSFGTATDTLAPADYDGDGKTDIAVFRNGIFYIQSSASSLNIYQNFGTAGDVPIASAYVQ